MSDNITLPNPVLPPGPVPQGPQTKEAIRSLISGTFDSVYGSEGIPQEKVTEHNPHKGKDEAQPELVNKPEDQNPTPEETQVEEQQPEAQPEEGNDPPEGDKTVATPQAKAKWGELKKKAKDYDKLVEEHTKLKEQVEAASGPNLELEAMRKKVESLTKQIEDNEGELYLGRIEGTQKFKATVTEPRNQLLKYTEDLAKDVNLDPNALLELIHRGDKSKLADFIQELPEPDRIAIYNIQADLRTLARREDDLRANAKDAYESLSQREKEQYDSQHKRILEERGNAVKELTAGYADFIKELPESERPDFNAVEEEIRQMDQWPEKYKAFGGVAAVMMPQVMAKLKAVNAELAAAKKELTAFRNGGPKTNQGKSPGAQGAPKEERKTDVSVEDWSKGVWERITGKKVA